MLAAATGLPGQSGSNKFALAKPGTQVSAGKASVRVDSICPAGVYISLFGPDGAVFKADQLPLGVWKPYSTGKTEFFVKATTDGTGKEAFFSFSF